jgi:hypothetical protein
MNNYALNLLFLSGLLLFACKQDNVQGTWIKGTEEEKLAIIEEQLGGFSAAMMEIQYRYNELYWAGMDQNWGYADHQIEHLEEALDAGLERRPNRAKSAEHFRTYSIQEMEEAIASKDQAVFLRAFENMRISCNNCHAMEKMPFFNVVTPEQRLSPIRWPVQ